MTRYDDERKKRGDRKATTEEAARELGAAFNDLGEQILKAQTDFLRRVNEAWRRRPK